MKLLFLLSVLSFRRPKGGRISRTCSVYVLEILRFALDDNVGGGKPTKILNAI